MQTYFLLCAGSHPLYLTLTDYAAGVHTLTLLFETSAGVEQFQGAFYSPGSYIVYYYTEMYQVIVYSATTM